MLVLNDFQCEACGRVEERLEERSHEQVICHACGATAFRLIRAVRSVLDPIRGDFPGATDKWLKHREQRMKEERKTEERHGTPY